jgi:hypothetical protein
LTGRTVSICALINDERLTFFFPVEVMIAVRAPKRWVFKLMLFLLFFNLTSTYLAEEGITIVIDEGGRGLTIWAINLRWSFAMFDRFYLILFDDILPIGFSGFLGKRRDDLLQGIGLKRFGVKIWERRQGEF